MISNFIVFSAANNTESILSNIEICIDIQLLGVIVIAH